MKFLKVYFGLVVLQLIFVSIIIVLVTVIRFVDNQTYNKMMNEYSEYAHFYTDISYVYDGE